ncbi:F0F1 ATP synthase subunit epsilon [Methylicorpusculum oleiharenae]|uniref:F0F1 ATP synthase subunit epsilon n=1 Tax=Methylicorpusculum oleiharenae TaxID=1338687 RepID=UPI001357A4D4|nr:F0F1 ATP synthase subunit epsilon [Methylicorpusculum oleiharenae]MCD2452307.1 F0F1 ATP synthase subunit epsilon [Methylicorpusculum oleiharenae]
MTDFVLQLYDAAHEQRIAGVTSFMGEDASGSFGILPNHDRFMTVLVFGLARFRQTQSDWQYLGLPGGVLYFHNNELTVSTRHFIIDSDLEKISALLEEQLLKEEENLQATRQSIKNLEQAMIKRMMALNRKSMELL